MREIRWCLVHVGEDECTYRSYDADTGQWLTPPQSRTEAINHCHRALGWGVIRIQTELGAAILFGERRRRQALNAQQHKEAT